MFKLYLIGFLIFTLVNACYASESSVSFPKETIKNKNIGLNGFSWYYGFDIELINQNIVVTVAINLIPASGVSMVELLRVIPIWKKGIEQVWSNKFALKTAYGNTYTIVFNVRFHGPKFHHAVIVRHGKGQSDELNWNLRDSEQIVAHEFGHMIGAYDEYKRGANDPYNPIFDKSSVMTRNPETGQSYVRHFRKIKDWFANKSKDKSVRVISLSRS